MFSVTFSARGGGNYGFEIFNRVGLARRDQKAMFVTDRMILVSPAPISSTSSLRASENTAERTRNDYKRRHKKHHGNDDHDDDEILALCHHSSSGTCQ